MDSVLPTYPQFSSALRVVLLVILANGAFSSQTKAQTNAFTNATFTFTTFTTNAGVVTTNNFGNTNSMQYNGTIVSDLSVGNLVKSAGLSNASSIGNFRASGWTSGASLDPADYIGFSLTAVSGSTLAMSNFNFGIGRSGTGTRAWAWYYSTNGFVSSDILTNYTTLAAGLTNTVGVLTHDDLNNGWVNNVLNLSELSGLTNVEFRLFSWLSEGAAGTAGLQGPFAFSGALVSTSTNPLITVSASALSGLTATQGAAGIGTNFFTAGGSNLSNNITVVANDSTNFAIATNVSGPFANTAILFTNSSGAVTNTPIYVRLTGTNVGDFTNTVSLSSLGATTTNVTVGGTVVPPPTPTLTVAPTNVSGLQTFQGSPSSAPFGTYDLSGTTITNAVTVSAPAGLQLSTNSVDFNTSLSIPAPLGGTLPTTPIFIRIASTAGLGAFTNFVTNSTLGASSNTLVRVTGDVLAAGTPTILPVDGTKLTNFSTIRPDPSVSQSVTVSGTNLTAPITITPPPGWQISTNAATNTFTNPTILLTTNPAGVVSNTAVFVRLAGTNANETSYLDSPLKLVSGAASNNVLLSGVVSNPPPFITLSNNALTNFNTPLGMPSSFQSFFAGGTNLTNDITVAAPANFVISFTNDGTGLGSSVTIPRVGDAAALRQVYVRMTGATAGTFSNSITLTSGSAAAGVPVTGTVVPPPAITLTMPANMRQGDPGSGTVSLNSAPSNDVVVALSCSAPNLLVLPVTVTVPAGTNSVDFTFDSFGSAPTTTVTSLALAAGYAEGKATTILTPDPSAASFGVDGYQQSFAGFLSQATLPSGWTVSSAGTNADNFTAWASTTSGSKFSVPGTNVFGFQHVEATGTARQVLTLRNDTGVTLTNLIVRYNGRVARADQPRAPVYTVEVAGTVMSNLTYSTLNSDNLLRVATNRSVQIAPGQTFQVSWSSDRGTNAGGTARQIGISAVNLSSSVTPVASITASPTNITGLVSIADFVSSPQAAFVSGTNLPTNRITVTPPLGFEVSTNFAGGFSTNVFSIPASAGGVPVTPLYVRVAADASPGTLSGMLAFGSVAGTNSVSAQVALSALVFSNAPGAQLLVDQSSLTNFSTAFPSNSTSQSFQVAATGLSSNPLTVLASSSFAVSIDNVNFTNSVSLAPVGGAIGPRPVYVALRGLQIGANTGTVSLSANNIATQIINLSGQVDPPPPVITVDTGGMPTNSPQFSTPEGRPSAFGFFTTSASNLTTNVTVAAPQNYEISLSQTTNYGGTVILSNASGTIVGKPVFVRLTGAQLLPLRTNDISLTSGIAATNVTVTGQVTNAPPPDIGLLGTSLTNFVTVQGVPSPAQPFQASASNVLQPVTVEAPPDYEVSVVAGSGFGRSVQISPVNYGVRPTTLYLRLSDSAAVGENISGVVRASSPAVDGSIVFGNDLPVSGTVTTNTAPFIVALPKSLAGFGAIAGGVSTNQLLSVGGTNLNDFLTISTTNAYQLSPTGGSSTFTNTIRLVPFTPGAIAQDRGLNYYNGTNIVTPTTGMGRGNGFGNWTITSSTNSGGSAGIFVGSPTNAGIVGMGPDSFGLFANPASASNRVVARRDFAQPLQTNEVFSFQWGNNFDAGNAGSKGMRLLQGTNAVLTIAMGGSANLTVRNGTNAPVNMFTNYGTNAINVFIERTSANLLTVKVPSGRDGGAGYTNAFPNPNTPTGFEFFAQALQGGPPNENRDRAQPYFNNLVVTTNGGVTSANVGPTNVFVRMVAASNSPVGPQNGALALVSAGATNKSVGLTGAVYGAPVLTVAPTNLTGFITTGGVASTNQRFDVVANALETDVALSVGGGFEVSLAADAGYTSNLIISNATAGAGSLTNFPIFVRLGTNGVTGPAVSTVQITASGFAGQTVSNSVAVSGTVFQSGSNAQIGEPQPASLTGFRTTLGQASQPQSYVFNAVNLGNRPVVASASAGYEVSLSTNGGWTNAVTNLPVGGIISGATNFVRISGASNLPVTNNLSGVVTLSSPGTNASNRTVALSGAVLPPPGIGVLPTTLTNLWTVQGFQSAGSDVFLVASNLQGPVTVNAAPPLLVSSGGSYGSTAVFTNTPAGTASGVLSVVVGANGTSVGVFSNANGITFSTPGAVSLPAVPVSYTVVARPEISPDTGALAGFRTVVGNASEPPQTFTVSGTNLLTNVVLALTNASGADKYEMSTNAATGWTNRITLIPNYASSGGSGPPVVIAQDSGANYTGDPVTGNNGGIGFSPWTITVGTTNAGSAGIFVGNPTNAGIGGMSTNSFGLYANPATNANFVNAVRQFAAPLAVGESFSFQWGNNYDAGSGNKGVNLVDANGGNIFKLNMGNSAAITLAQGTNAPLTVQPGTSYGTNVMTFTFARTASNSFRVSAPAGRNLGPGFTNNFTVTNQVAGFVFYAIGLQAGTPVDRDSAQPYFNNLLVTAPGSGSSGGVVSNTAIYVRLRSDAPVGRAQQQIDLTSGPYAELKSVSLDGDVLPKPVYSITPSALTNLSTVTNTPSVPGVLLVNAANLVSNLVVGVPGSVPNAFQISTNASSGFTNLLTIPPGTGTLANLPLYVRIASWPNVQFVSNSLTFSNRFAATELTNVPVAGQVLQANPGDPRPGFNPPSAGSSVAGPPVSTVASATNGSFYIGGNFTSLVRSNNGTTNTNSAIRVARILADGAVDTGFDAGQGPNAEVRALLYSAADAGLYIGGQFTSVAGVARTGLARLAVGKTGLADGALDPAFVPIFTGVQPPVVNEIVQQYDGKILVGGIFANAGGLPSANLARLLANGEVDLSFAPPGPRGAVNAIALQPDGKILIGGSFAEVGGLPRRGLARLNRDGSVDPTFNVGTGADGGFNGTVFSVAVGLDGSIYAGGQFSSYRGQSVYNNLAKLSPTGELRGEFNFAASLSGGIDGPVRSLIMRPTGALFISGNFSQIANSVLFPTPVPAGRVAQMLPDGMVDTAFNPGSPGANNAVLDAATLANGDLVVVGSFTDYDGEPRSGMAVLAGFNGLTPIITSPFFYTVNAGQPVSFAFTGTGPEPVSFSLAGGSGTNPPAAVLPEGVSFAAPGSLTGYPMKSGAYDMFVSSRPASGEPSAPTPFTFYVVPAPVSYESWTKAWFGSQWTNPVVAAPGVSARNPSGLNNLAVYALDGGNPLTLGPGIAPFALPVTDTNGLTFLNYTVRRNPLAMASYSVLYSTNLLLPWLTGTNNLQTLIDTPELLEVRPVVPMSLEAQQFLRLRINMTTNQAP